MDQSIGNDSNQGSSDSQWKNIWYADEKMTDGDTLNIKAMANNPHRGNMNTSTNNLTVQGTDGETAYILGSRDVSSGANIGSLAYNTDLDSWTSSTIPTRLAVTLTGDSLITQQTGDFVQSGSSAKFARTSTGTGSLTQVVYLPANTEFSINFDHFETAGSYRFKYNVREDLVTDNYLQSDGSWSSSGYTFDDVGNSNGHWASYSKTFTTNGSSTYYVTVNMGYSTTSYLDNFTIIPTENNYSWSVYSGDIYKLDQILPDQIKTLTKCTSAVWTSLGASALSNILQGSSKDELFPGQWTWESGTLYYRLSANESDITGIHFEAGMIHEKIGSIGSTLIFGGNGIALNDLSLLVANNNGLAISSGGSAIASRVHSFFSNYVNGSSFSSDGDLVANNCTGSDSYIGFLASGSDASLVVNRSLASNNYNKGIVWTSGADGAANYSIASGNGLEEAANNTGIAVHVGGESDVNMYNNTSQGNYGRGIGVSGSGLIITKNNIAYNTEYGASSDFHIADFSGSLTHTNNIGGGYYSGWSPLTSEQLTNPLFIDSISHDFTIQSTSPAIDAGTDVGLATDYAGNPIYGLPDIGAYEYQPPYTMGSNQVDVAADVRVYGNGKFRNTETPNGTDADLSVDPASDNITQYLDIDIATWETSGDYEKQWTESSTTITGNTLHTVGDLEAGKYYNITADDAVTGLSSATCDAVDSNFVCQADSNGQIVFTWTGGYSTHTFTVTEGDNLDPTVTNGTSAKFHTDTTSVTLSLVTSENSTCKYSTENTTYDNMTTFTNTGGTTHTTIVNSLTPSNYSYYAICRDTVGNDTSYTLTFEIAQRENDTGISDAKLKINGNNETLDKDKKIYFDEDEGRLKGQDDTIANGTVKIYKEGKRIATVDVGSDGSWSKRLSFGHNKTYTLKLKFYDQYGTLRDEKEHDVKVDTEKPVFINPFSQTLSIQKDDKINFEATDDTGIDYYKIQILDKLGHIARAWRKQIKSFYLIPENILEQADTIMVRAYDKAGNYAEEKAVLNITNASNDTLADNSGNESSKQEASNASKPNVCNYTVQAGDTLWSIAKTVYGDATEYQKIIDLNKDKYLDIESKLSIGQELNFGCENNNAVQGVSDEKSNTNDANNQPGQAQSEARETFKWWNPFSWF
ncbi:MAG: choice-of-anchor Q domain-containing protein [Candidatus Moraniibacteriota bacterium]